MSKVISVIMYHYVRELKKSRFPLIRARTTKEFRSQLSHLSKTMNFVKPRDLIEAVINNEDLPRNAAILTFDDGYADHFSNVFPILDEMNLEGMFFLPGEPISKGIVMDVNKIHFILASQPNTSKVLNEINEWISINQRVHELPNLHGLYNQFEKKSIYDNSETIYIKLILQRVLPKKTRNALTDFLFKKYVTKDEKSFSAELYLSQDQIKIMYRHGQFFGSHSYSHEWLDLLSEGELNNEIIKSMIFLEKLGISLKNWVMCYPYGNSPPDNNSQLKLKFDKALYGLLEKHNCALAFKDGGGLSNIDKDNKYMISRIDTNEMPF